MNANKETHLSSYAVLLVKQLKEELQEAHKTKDLHNKSSCSACACNSQKYSKFFLPNSFFLNVLPNVIFFQTDKMNQKLSKTLNLTFLVLVLSCMLILTLSHIAFINDNEMKNFPLFIKHSIENHLLNCLKIGGPEVVSDVILMILMRF